MSIAVAPTAFESPARSRHAAEHRVGLAFLCSGVLHLIVIVSGARYIGEVAVPGPRARGDAAPLTAVLQAPPIPDIPLVEMLPVPPLPPEIVAPVPVEPAREPAPAPPATGGTAPSVFGVGPLVGPNVAPDPDGRISYGMVTDPRLVGGALARRLAERYPVTPYKTPNVQGSLSLAYPAAARERHTSARIAAVLDLDERGTITAVTLVPDEPVFGPTVLAAIKEARLSPGQTPTGPVPYWAIVEFVFAIAPAPAPAPGEAAPLRTQ